MLLSHSFGAIKSRFIESLKGTKQSERQAYHLGHVALVTNLSKSYLATSIRISISFEVLIPVISRIKYTRLPTLGEDRPPYEKGHTWLRKCFPTTSDTGAMKIEISRD